MLTDVANFLLQFNGHCASAFGVQVLATWGGIIQVYRYTAQSQKNLLDHPCFFRVFLCLFVWTNMMMTTKITNNSLI